VASVQSSPGGLPWWGVGERRESRRRSFCSDSGVRRRDSVRLLGLAGAVVDGRWGAGEGQGAFKKGWPGISACAPAVSAAGIAGGGVAVAREEDGAAIGPGLSAGGGEPGKRGPRSAEGGARERTATRLTGERVGPVARGRPALGERAGCWRARMGRGGERLGRS
jgi:hypothetical protein